MRASLLLAMVAAGLGVGAGPAGAAPPEFPDVDAYPAVDPAAYQVIGARPSTSGWAFRTPAGLRCQTGLIPDLGVSCMTPAPDDASGWAIVAVTLTKPGQLFDSEGGPGEGAYPLLPTGSKFAAGNGVVCAALDDATLACRAAKPDSWAADTPDPPDRHYGEHGFVTGPTGTWTY